MFTGLVEDIGTVVRISRRGNGDELAIRTAIPLADVAVGDSIAVNGACLTAESFAGDVFTAVAGRETLERTSLCQLRVGQSVHLERALRLGAHVGGHLVQGHVDAVGELTTVQDARESRILWVTVPAKLMRYVAEKGSIAVDGVSLTVNELDGQRFRVNVVPHSKGATRLGSIAVGSAVNIEVDILAKYVERMLLPAPTESGGGGLTLETLSRYGFTS